MWRSLYLIIMGICGVGCLLPILIFLGGAILGFLGIAPSRP